MGTRGRGRGRRGCRDRRRDHRIPATELRGVYRLCPAGVRTGLLLGILAGVRRPRPADPSWQASATDSLKQTESLFADEREPFFNDIGQELAGDRTFTSTPRRANVIVFR